MQPFQVSFAPVFRVITFSPHEACDAQRRKSDDITANIDLAGEYAPRYFPGMREAVGAGNGVRDNPSAFRKAGAEHGTRMIDKVEFHCAVPAPGQLGANAHIVRPRAAGEAWFEIPAEE